ncbi:Metal-binding trascriptional regulator, contains putative Fe-S cluster and ArsR family DNA binding domain [Desulforhopalus singaporensis]|uniref:Metal-binding trascriptional regulator, contains putative Fe-S cluster and ArsR family DNA binding domain n=2 Tax=Desulforhopalus singaporensis TaxID=91360 RepID=A0A1H0STS1_9BACT|nr:Metal-binding trascriptional regulator, contains putative Fe-S cluster and ArsR family DNA binding domain [Desulforhopalus singaporensis]
MLLTGYRVEIFKSKCDAKATGVHCFAHLNNDISEVLPYLNSVLGGHVYTADPPSLMIKNYGKLITLHARKIAVNALRDAEEAEKIIAWLQREINETWQRRDEIEPTCESESRPLFLEVFKLLPKTNCRECGEKTCTVFAFRAVEGSVDQDDCPALDGVKRKTLKNYLSRFRFD